jgi:hypothetical protein
MAGAGAMKNRPEFADLGKSGRISVNFSANMTTTSGSYEVHAEARGPHWIAWISRGSDPKPDRSVILVAATEAEARAHAERWAAQTAY